MAKYRIKMPPVDAFQYTGDLNAFNAWSTSLTTPITFTIDTSTSPEKVTVMTADAPQELDVNNFVIVDGDGVVTISLDSQFLDNYELVAG